MNTSLDSVIQRLEALREEVGGDAHVRIRHDFVLPEYEQYQTKPIDCIQLNSKLIGSGEEERTVREVVIIPYTPSYA